MLTEYLGRLTLPMSCIAITLSEVFSVSSADGFLQYLDLHSLVHVFTFQCGPRRGIDVYDDVIIMYSDPQPQDFNLIGICLTSSVSSVVASLVNLIVIYVLHAMVKYEGHLTITDWEANSVFNISLLLISNAILTTVIHGIFIGTPWYRLGSVIIVFIPISNCVIGLFNKILLVPVAYIRRAYKMARAKSQEQREKIHRTVVPRFRLSDMYSFIYVAYWYAWLFGILVPLVVPVTLVCVVLYCVADRVNGT